MPLDGDVTDYSTKANVVRVKTVVSENDFNNILFPKKKAVYTYAGFLQAIAKFPKFCDEDNLSNYTQDEACKRELATLFAHFAQESGHHSDTDKDALGNKIDKWRQGLYHIHEHGCPEDDGTYDDACDDYRPASTEWSYTAYPMNSTVDYYGRGPF